MRKLLGTIFYALVFCSVSQAMDEDKPPHYHLKSNTGACNGYFKLGDSSLDWKSSGAHWKCDYTPAIHNTMRATWVLKTQTSKKCAIGMVEIRLQSPNQPDAKDAPREVTAFKSPEDFRDRRAPRLDCNMK